MEHAINQAVEPQSQVLRIGADAPLLLESGLSLAPLQIAYQTYGTLNPAKTNAILICHALTGDQHLANEHPVTGKSGWWISMVGQWWDPIWIKIHSCNRHGYNW